MRVVFPDPRKPVTIVIGVGMAFAETVAAVPGDPGDNYHDRALCSTVHTNISTNEIDVTNYR